MGVVLAQWRPVAGGATGEALRTVHRALDRALDRASDEVVAVPDGTDPRRLIGEVDRAITRLQSLRLDLVRAADRAHVSAASGASGTAAWLASATRADTASAARDVKLATALSDTLPATREALAQGTVSTAHAQVIATATGRLPQSLTDRERSTIEVALVERAKLVDPGTLRKAARRALAAAERSQAEVDADEDEVVRSEEDRALARTRLSWHDNRDGTLSGHFTVPILAGHMLVKVIQQMASPRRFAQRAAQAARNDAASRGETLTTTGTRDRVWEAFRTDSDDWAHRYGSAFAELLEHLPTDRLSGKVNATVLVTMDADTLRDQGRAKVSETDVGTVLSAGQARRLACSAGLVPLVLGGASHPLDLGRAGRFFTEHQRTALAARYTACAADTCDRPYAWTELHHENPWSAGGATDLHLAVPLCGHHHRLIHHAGFDHRIATDPRGVKSVTFHRRP
ncbi:HNH endonuclease signature motif containing protein [Nostocoides sp. HKS02]|uniref:HNH endonuclease signature motif containing protein n=1 Tax=Nostocoides sp. HKS02 TaxID=1813880 RepID=UPI0018A7F5F3|nr:HNH endonuclease signature motif containing protein [Tetrasphaera sp. HKS02]